MESRPALRSQKQLAIIKSFQFQLKVTLHYQNLHLLLFHRMSGKHYQQSYNNMNLSYLLNRMYGNTSNLFQHLEKISSQQQENSLSKYFKFDPPKLQMITYICGNQMKVVLDFHLEELSQFMNNQLLKQKLEILQSQERILSRKQQRLHQTWLQQQANRKGLTEQVIDLGEQQRTLLNSKAKKTKGLALTKTHIDRKQKIIKKTDQLKLQDELSPQQFQLELNAIQNIQFQVEYQHFLEKKNRNVIRVVRDLTIGRQKLLSPTVIYLQSIFKLSLRIINMNFGVIMGITKNSKLFQLNYQSSNCIALSCQDNIVNIFGNLSFLANPIKRKSNDILTMLVDRVNNKIQFTNNDVTLFAFDFPYRERVYPFLYLNAGDQIELTSFDQVNLIRK